MQISFLHTFVANWIFENDLITHNGANKHFLSPHRTTDSAQNHVDRVRVPDTTYDFGGPGRGSGWRQRSLSNIDLTSQSKHSFTRQNQGYTSGLYDLYSRLEARKNLEDSENHYGNLNPSHGKNKNE